MGLWHLYGYHQTILLRHSFSETLSELVFGQLHKKNHKAKSTELKKIAKHKISEKWIEIVRCIINDTNAVGIIKNKFVFKISENATTWLK